MMTWRNVLAGALALGLVLGAVPGQVSAQTATLVGQTAVATGAPTLAGTPVSSRADLAAAFATKADIASPAFSGVATFQDVTINGTLRGAGSFLPLGGGALTGGLSGTTGSFSGALSGATVAASGNATVGGTLGVTGVTTIGGAGNSTITFTPGANSSTAPLISTTGTAGMQLNGGATGVAIVGGGPLVSNNGMTLTRILAVAGAMPQPVNWSWNLSGTTTTVGPPSLITLQSSSDTLAAQNPGSDQIRVMSVFQNFGGPTMTGARTAFFVKGTGIAASGNPGVGIAPNYQAVAFNYQQNVSEGGVGNSQGATVGDVFAGGSTLRITASAAGFHEATNWEFDMNIASPVYKKRGVKVTQLGSDVAQGVLDGAFVIENGGTSANNGWHNGFLAIEPNADFPYATDGWILNAPLATDFATFNTMAGGINMVDPTFTTGAIRSRNFLVDGLGTVRVGNAYLTKTAGGASLDASGSIGPAEGATLSGAAIVSGGSGFVGGVLYDPYGGSWAITAQSGGVITLLTCLRTPYFASATPPANPITLTPWLALFGNVGGPVTVNMPWTQPNVIALGGVGTVTVNNAIIGGSTPLAGTFTTLTASSIKVGANQVVGARQTGWTAMTGTPDLATAFATSTVTLAQLAGRVMSLQAAMTTHGLIGP